MVVSVSGYNFTGSGAVVDLLKEYEEVSCVDREIPFVHLPDGLIDLEYHVNHAATYFNGDVAVERFWQLCRRVYVPEEHRAAFLQLARDYLDRITEAEWQGNSCFDGTRKDGSTYAWWKARRMFAIFVWHYFHKISSVCNRTMYLAHHTPCFAEATEQFLDSFFQLLGADDKVLVLNQFFSAYQPEMSMKYAKGAKAIVVDRDPRDTFIVGRTKRRTQCYPIDDVRKFVAYYKRCWEALNKQNSEQVLHLQFEDVVYHYQDSVKKIEDFLGVRQHSSPKKFFKPEVSINNTQLKERFPEMAEDIAYIERELAAYLYPFPEIRKADGDFF